jgi:hypothetical protein
MNVVKYFTTNTFGKLSVLVFWVVTECGLKGRHKCFRETYISFSSPEDGDSMSEIVVSYDHMVLKPRRPVLISLLREPQISY